VVVAGKPLSLCSLATWQQLPESGLELAPGSFASGWRLFLFPCTDTLILILHRLEKQTEKNDLEREDLNLTSFRFLSFVNNQPESPIHELQAPIPEWRHFPPDIINEGSSLVLPLSISYHQLGDMMCDHG